LYYIANLKLDTLDKKKRLQEFFKKLEQLGPCACPVTAFETIKTTFFKQEASVDREARMFMPNVFEALHKMKVKDREIYFLIQKKHLVVVADNGAFEVRKTEMLLSKDFLQKNILYVENSMEPVLEKLGADGRGVWS